LQSASEDLTGRIEPEITSPITERTALWIVALLTSVGFALRYFGCLNDLWLDELISIHTAHSLHSWTQVFTSVHMDNNHYLNTLYLYLVGPQPYWPIYRFLSLFFGTLTIWAAYWSLKNRSQVQALLFATLIAFSYPLVHFSSEARGYSGAVLACVLAFGLLQRWLAAPTVEESAQWGALYSGSLVFGLLSHLTFLFVAVALALFSIIATRHRRGTVAANATIHIAPALSFLVLAYLDFRGFFTLGGTQSTAIHELSRLLANVIGWPLHDAYSAWIIGLPLFFFVAFQLSRRPRNIDSSLFLVLAAILILFAVANKPSFVAQRYFLVFVPFGYCALAIAMSRMRRTMVVAPLGLLIVGNISLYAHFLKDGRGHYQAALHLIAQKSTVTELRIASDQKFRAGVELDFYQRTLPPLYTIRIIPKASAEVHPDWLITHDDAFAPPRPDVLTGTSGKAIKVAYFGCSELSGEAWTVYRLYPSTAESSGNSAAHN
jgi:hypothetical protein